VAHREVKLHESWRSRLQPEFDSPWFGELVDFLHAEKAAGKAIFPPGRCIFNALDSTPFESVRAVILGQDPYHGPGQAHGLCFSVNRGVPKPPSLVNIFKELQSDLGIPAPSHGNLEAWTRRGVLLLNTCLTVRQGEPLSHQNRGWERLTDRIVQLLAERETPMAFLLWGSPAQRKVRCADLSRHGVFCAPHPSPLSAHRGFFGSRPFSQANAFLQAHGQDPIDWSLPE
jgi:uracil-DNA glycosylase